MEKRLGWIAAIALALVATPAGARAADSPPVKGTVSIEPSSVEGIGDAPMSAFVDAARTALTDKGFAVLNAPGHAAYVMDVVVSRADVGTGLAAVHGGAPMVAGAGVSLSLSNGSSKLMSVQRTRLEMRLHRRDSAGVLWRGVAVTVRTAGTRKGAPQIVATDLTRVLLQSYPAQSTEIVGVP